MSFTETDTGAAAANYQILATHAATGLGLVVSVVSTEASGVVPESDIEAIIADLAQILASDTRFQGLTAVRTRAAHDVWTQPTPQQ